MDKCEVFEIKIFSFSSGNLDSFEPARFQISQLLFAYLTNHFFSISDALSSSLVIGQLVNPRDVSFVIDGLLAHALFLRVSLRSASL